MAGDVDLRAVALRLRARAAPHWPLLPGLVLGFLLRFWGLLPAFLYGDEAEYATVARSLAHDPRALQYPPLEGFGIVPFVSQPPFLLYTYAAFTKLTGSEVAGPLVVSALLGTATIAIVYALGVLVRDRWLGGLAAGFLAVLPFHVAVSRSAQLDAGFTFLFSLSLLLFLMYVRRPSLGRALGTGGAVAATALAKLPGILVLFPMGVVLAVRALEMRRQARVDRDLRRRLAGQQALRQTGLHVLAAALPVALLTLGYLLHLWLLHATSDFATKIGWQAGRVHGSSSGNIPRGWDWYFTDPQVGLLEQWGLVLVGLALVGWLMALRDLRDPRRRWLMLTLVLWPAVILAFLVASSRKEWFYALPLSPPGVLLATWPVHAAARKAWQFSRPTPGEPWWQTPGAVLAVVGLAAMAAFAPLNFALQQKIGGRDYGYGLREAAAWIDGEDPAAAQLGTTLGRFSLHFYNDHPTYHYYVNHTWLDQQVAAGHLRYVVVDPYLDLEFEQQWLETFVQAHKGTLAKSFDNGRGRQVDVYKLG
ncbi:MAG TPA: glycosyltransferase family 39 protein [Candidatus Thermoplasmatota archaeon]|nr:glycosyltransferase family 39 protein [Candidatus Thermoplasmatota archaeon]